MAPPPSSPIEGTRPGWRVHPSSVCRVGALRCQLPSPAEPSPSPGIQGGPGQSTDESVLRLRECSPRYPSAGLARRVPVDSGSGRRLSMSALPWSWPGL